MTIRYNCADNRQGAAHTHHDTRDGAASPCSHKYFHYVTGRFIFCFIVLWVRVLVKIVSSFSSVYRDSFKTDYVFQLSEYTETD